MCKSSIFLILYLFIQLYTAKVGSGSGENFPDPYPTKKVRIRKPVWLTCNVGGKGVLHLAG